MTRRGKALLALLVVPLVGACEAVESRDGVQCQTTADCSARGPEFAGTICSSGLCEAIVVPDTQSSSACTSSDSCLFSLGVAGRCIKGACVSLTPQSTVTSAALCTTYGPVSSDTATLIGAILPFNASIAGEQSLGIGYETSDSNGVLFNGILGVWNSTAASATPPGPQFGVVVCDETDLAGAEALFGTVKPAFVVGPYADSRVKQVLQDNLSIPLFAPLADGSYFTQSGGTHYSCSPSLTNAVPAFQSSIDQVARFAATTRAKTSVKVALVEDSGEPNEAEFATNVTNELTFNGEAASSSAVFQSFDVNSGTDRIDIDSSSGGVGISQANAIAVFQPDVVVLTSPVWSPSILDQIERRWSGLNRSLPPPIYLIMRTSPAVATFYQGGSSASLTNRIFALQAGQSSEEVTNYRALQLQFADLGTTEPYGGAEFSDCLFAGMYGYTAAAESNASSQVTSAQFIQGVAQVTHTATDGSARGDLQADPTKILDVLSLLSNKATIELVGTDTYLGLDPTSGIPNQDAPSKDSTLDMGDEYTIECPVQSPGSPGWQAAGVTYDKTAPGTPAGTLACPAQ